jgi:hypothetical protein
VDPTDDNGTQLEKETDHVYGSGLLALSLSGNKLSGKGILSLTRVLRKNYWLLGLNLADNHLDADSLQTLVSCLQSNAILQTLLLKGNPGLPTSFVSPMLRDIAARNTNTVSPSSAVLPLTATSDDDSEGDLAQCNGYKRLALLPDKVVQLLRLWIKLQTVENSSSFGDVDGSLLGDSSSQQWGPDYSFLTLSTTQSRKRYLAPKSRESTPRRQDLGVAAAYSIFYFLDPEVELPTSYRQTRSPSSSRSAPNSSVHEVHSNSFIGASDDVLRSPPRPSFHTKERYSGEVESERFGDTGDFHDDPLRFAIAPTQSPPRASSSHGTAGHQRDFEEQYEDEVERQSWDNSRLWPVSDFTSGYQTASHVEDRPPSRMSLRPTVEHEVARNYNKPPSSFRVSLDRRSFERPTTSQRSLRPVGYPQYGQVNNRHVSPKRSGSASGTRKNVTAKAVSAGVRHDSAMLSPSRGRSAVFGKAERDTGMRPRSLERPRLQNTQSESTRYYRNHSDASASRRLSAGHPRRRSSSAGGTAPHKGVARRVSDPDSRGYMAALDQHVQDLTRSMNVVTHNLVVASERFQHASETFNDSMAQQQRSLNHSQMQSFFPGESVADWVMNSASKAARPVPSSGDRGQVASGIATHFHQHADRNRLMGSAEKAPGDSTSESRTGGARRSVNRSDLNGFSSFISDGGSAAAVERDLGEGDLALLVRARLYSRLEELLVA